MKYSNIGHARMLALLHPDYQEPLQSVLGALKEKNIKLTDAQRKIVSLIQRVVKGETLSKMELKEIIYCDLVQEVKGNLPKEISDRISSIQKSVRATFAFNIDIDIDINKIHSLGELTRVLSNWKGSGVKCDMYTEGILAKLFKKFSLPEVQLFLKQTRNNPILSKIKFSGSTMRAFTRLFQYATLEQVTEFFKGMRDDHRLNEIMFSDKTMGVLTKLFQGATLGQVTEFFKSTKDNQSLSEIKFSEVTMRALTKLFQGATLEQVIEFFKSTKNNQSLSEIKFSEVTMRALNELFQSATFDQIMEFLRQTNGNPMFEETLFDNVTMSILREKIEEGVAQEQQLHDYVLTDMRFANIRRNMPLLPDKPIDDSDWTQYIGNPEAEGKD